MAILRLLAALFLFVGILVGCIVMLFLLLVLLRFPLLLFAVLLSCWILSLLQQRKRKNSDS